MIGKTGTTDNQVNTWMVGSSTEVATAVWVGNIKGDTSLRRISNGTVLRHDIFRRLVLVGFCRLVLGLQFLELIGKILLARPATFRVMREPGSDRRVAPIASFETVPEAFPVGLGKPDFQSRC